MAGRSRAAVGMGILPTIRAFLLGERDLVDERLRDISRQGSGVAKLAHVASFMLIVLFSLGSLVALSGESLHQFEVDWAHGQVNVSAAVSTAVSPMLVVAMDVAILYGARMLRLLSTRRAERAERRWHIAVVVLGCLLEAATYIYMSSLYEHPSNAAAWTIVVLRGIAAPLFGVYLSLAQPLPVGPRDVLYQVEYGAGAGLIRDAATLANDSHAPLERKAQLYDASASMRPSDREQLQKVIEVLAAASARRTEADATSHHDTTRAQSHASAEGTNSKPTAEPVSIFSSKSSRNTLRAQGDDPDEDEEPADGERSNVRTGLPGPTIRPVKDRRRAPRADTGMDQHVRAELQARRKHAARRIVSQQDHPDRPIGVREFARGIERDTGHSVSVSKANELLAAARVEKGSQIALEPMAE
jgi:hypothetical protein